MAINYQSVPITEDESGARLDRFLRKKYPYLTQGIIEKSLRNKLIAVNQKKALSNYRLNQDDYLEISSNLIQQDYKTFKKSPHTYSLSDVQHLIDNIIYRDSNFIVMNKPSGIAVQGGSKIQTSIDDLMPCILDHLGTWNEETTHKLVHRIDKETSGILLVALNNSTAQELADAFKNHLIKKKYLAILQGRVKIKNGQISSIINKENGKIQSQDNAITNYKVLAQNSKYSLVEFQPITGKKHQLRLHSLELGFPILGDSKYDTNYKLGTNLHLHASEIEFTFKGQKFKLKADLPDYLKKNINEQFGRIKW